MGSFSCDKPRQRSTPVALIPIAGVLLTLGVALILGPALLIRGYQLGRINAAVDRFALVYVGGQDSRSSVQVRALQTELKSALDALKMDMSKERLDLTSTLFAALNAVHISLYSTLKASLSGNQSVSTKLAAEAESVKSVGLYFCVQELLRLAPAPSGEDPSSPKVPPLPHLVVNLSSHGEPFGLPLLATAIKFRLSRLIPALAGIGGNTAGALEAAVVAGDDSAMATVLASELQRGPSRRLLEKLRVLAARAAALWGQNSTIARRLVAVLTAPSSELELQGTLSFQPSNPYFATATADDGSSASTPTAIPNSGGFIDLGLQTSGLLGAPGSSLQNNAPEPRRCRVSYIDVDNSTSRLPSQAELRALVRSGQPFVVRGDAFLRLLQKRWTYDRLRTLSLASSSAVSPPHVKGLPLPASDTLSLGDIPYAEIFGRPQVPSSLADYLGDCDSKGSMREWTARLGRVIDKKGVLLDVSDPLVVKALLAPHGLPPLYSFGTVPAAAIEEKQWLLGREGGKGQKWRTEATFLRQLLRTLEGADNDDLRVDFQFFLGPALTGAPLHHHQYAVNGLVHGRKVWLLLPPGRDVYSTLHPLLFSSSGGVFRSDWPYKNLGTAADGASSDDHSLGPCVLEQKGGEIVVVPRHVTHSVLNLAETIGFAAAGI